MNDKDIIWVDVETTGLDTSTARICEIGWVKTNFDCSIVKSSHEFLIRLDENAILDGKSSGAFEINGYLDRINPDSMIDIRYALLGFSEDLRDCRLAGVNIGKFDYQVLKREFDTLFVNKFDSFLGDYRFIDVASTAYLLYLLGEVPDLKSSSTLAQWAGQPKEPKPHCALYGAWQALHIYRKILERLGINK